MFAPPRPERAGHDLAMAPRLPPTSLTATQLREGIGRGLNSALDAAEAAIARIEEREPEVGAWAFFDPELARARARDLDALRASGRPTGPLHGVPVALKDIIDTNDMPTECGTVLEAGRRPRADAVITGRLRAAGALILGKTVTTELATYAPGRTRNPHNRAHTPGGSSSGSAAAVADTMVPIAIGTQTNGSVIRPAAFCGVVGFKPSFGLVPRTGILIQSPSLDTVGVFARDIADAALVGDVIAGCDRGDRASAGATAPGLAALAASRPPVTPALAFVKSPVWERADAETGEAFAELAEELGGIDETALPEPFGEALKWHRAIMLSEMAHHYRRYAERGRDRLSPLLADMIDEGRAIAAHDYLLARDWQRLLAAALDAFFDSFDAIITPAAPGPAPEGLGSTGDPAFCTIWQLCGAPSVTLPLLTAGNGLPMGVQVVGRRGLDGRLLRTASWIAARLNGEEHQ